MTAATSATASITHDSSHALKYGRRSAWPRRSVKSATSTTTPSTSAKGPSAAMTRLGVTGRSPVRERRERDGADRRGAARHHAPVIVHLPEMVREVRLEMGQKASRRQPEPAHLERKGRVERGGVERGQRAGDVVGGRLDLRDELRARHVAPRELGLAIAHVARDRESV